MVALFWICAAVIAYVHLGYPCLMWLLARRAASLQPDDPVQWPAVTLIIAAYNEARVLAAKLENSLCLDYPPDRLEIVVASDGSTDATDAVANGYADRGVRLVRVEGRQGKTAAQNAAVAAATGEIVVFSDANALYDRDAVRLLVRHFARQDVGCVEGRRADYAPAATAAARHELAYRDWETRLKRWESRVLSCTGATGPIYAVRRTLYVPLNPAMISDLMEPLLIMARHGKRQVFEAAAVSREAVLPDLGDEFRRKVRIMTRCLNSLRMAPDALNPLRTGWFAAQVISHRLLRWLAPCFALTATAACFALLDRPFYRAVLLAQTAFAGAAALGAALSHTRFAPAFLRLPCSFCAANLAALAAVGNALLRRNVIALSLIHI